MPPLRGADEPAHFLRAYGLSRGEILSFDVDEKGRKGILLPAAMADDFAFFQNARYKVGTPGFAYGDVLTDYMRRRSAEPAGRQRRARRSSCSTRARKATRRAAYLPYIAAAALARLAGLDFLGTLYLMRFAGLAATTAL